jgi:mono/diheme cytochrome c family protein
MKKALKIAGTAVVLLVAGVATLVSLYEPKQRPASSETVERTPARLERGKYLVDSVLGCMDCHSTRDFNRLGGPVVAGLGAGGLCRGAEDGAPGRVCTPNITPDPETGIGAWTDGEVLRAIREGVDRQGKALFPMMPYTEYRHLSDEDARSVVAYLRTLPPIKKVVPDTEIKFPVSFFIKMAPRPLDGPVAEPNRQDRLAHGKYLARVGGCQFCHTPVDDKHQPIPGQDFSGGHEFKVVGTTVRSANLTPHATGLGERDEKAFVGMFKAFAVPEADLPAVSPNQNSLVMPWLIFARMKEEDLGAIHAYLRTVPAIERAVEKRPYALPPAPAPTASAGTPAAPAEKAQ